MSSIVEVSKSGTLQLPTEILQAIEPNTRFVVEVESIPDSVTKKYQFCLPFLQSNLFGQLLHQKNEQND
ncbi:hypothetical protein NIES2119_14885 [[Phormidium ambiguum] IAM M-71]|uniref:Uncharacterized protein n=1 Tax=[Phormidium ambiguum] IAM M-71 TaxID=454136 RepID=A0A1U7IJ00_9CYAN|nr:hypothetical protein [Phormidium ambiguum]OKH37101.1 hypothetical protein NIES2119_14885 [Phormidium ambiguum IAM M-71]